ncbi:MAG: NAD(P)H-binding protein [Deltaproteobacteria bacterium]|nr:NAD(P)H-binding protein [Deltaproteobacteria bacterium]
MQEPLAFVAGATGYTGHEVVRALRRRDLRTLAHLRPDSPRRAEWVERFLDLGAEPDLTPWVLEAMTETFARARPTHLFALLGTTRARGRAAEADHRGAESYETVDYGLTALLIDAARAAELAPRFIYLSAAGVTPTSRTGYYAARARAEQKLSESGLPYLIARPSFITGPDREESRPAERLGARVADSALALAGLLGGTRLASRYRSTTAAVLAESLVRLALDPAATNRVIESEELRPVESA